MAEIKPFLCIRPAEGKAADIAALPYDVYNRKEAKEEVEEILYKAHSNIDEIVRFLEWDGDCFLPAAYRMQPGESRQKNGKESWKQKVLNTLWEKDYWDIKADVLTDCCMNAFAYAESVPEEIFYRYLLCPRVSIEMLQPCRMALKKSICMAGTKI